MLAWIMNMGFAASQADAPPPPVTPPVTPPPFIDPSITNAYVVQYAGRSRRKKRQLTAIDVQAMASLVRGFQEVQRGSRAIRVGSARFVAATLSSPRARTERRSLSRLYREFV